MARPKKDSDEIVDENDEPTPQYVTVEQLNAAITGKLGEFKRQMPKLLEPTMAPVMTQLQELMAKLSGDTEQQDASSKKKAVGEDPEVARLRKEFQASQAAMQKMQDERAREVADAKRLKQRSLLDAALTKVGIVNESLRNGAARLLEDKVGHDEDGRIVFKRQNSYGLEESVDVETAVTDWAKTNDGKAFLPARKVAGTGSSAPNKTQTTNTPRPDSDRKLTKEEQLDVANRELAAALLGKDTYSDDE